MKKPRPFPAGLLGMIDAWIYDVQPPPSPPLAVVVVVVVVVTKRAFMR